jgi:hypothetical protein
MSKGLACNLVSVSLGSGSALDCLTLELIAILFFNSERRFVSSCYEAKDLETMLSFGVSFFDSC